MNTKKNERYMNFNFDQTSCYLISLEHRNDRRAKFYKNLSEMGFSQDNFKLVNAIKDDNFGGLGCAKSHLIALTDFITKENSDYCCIFEDDFNFRIPKKEAQEILEIAVAKLQPDVILLAGTQTISIPTPIKIPTHEIQKVFQSNSASGYIIKRNYVKNIINNILNSIAGMEKYIHIEPRELIYHSFAIDQIWKKNQHEDNWICTNPMIGYQTPGYSDIENKDVNYLENSQ